MEALNDVHRMAQSAGRKLSARGYEMVRDALDIIDSMEVSDEIVGEWTPDLREGGDIQCMLRHKVMSLSEYTINGYGEHTMVLHNHLLMQVLRIPCEDCTLRQLIKISLYTGLLTASCKATNFPDGVWRTFQNLKLGVPSTYVVNFESSEIPDLTGLRQFLSL